MRSSPHNSFDKYLLLPFYTIASDHYSRFWPLSPTPQVLIATWAQNLKLFGHSYVSVLVKESRVEKAHWFCALKLCGNIWVWKSEVPEGRRREDHLLWTLSMWFWKMLNQPANTVAIPFVTVLQIPTQKYDHLQLRFEETWIYITRWIVKDAGQGSTCGLK